jgi:Mo-dependent nitrogenase C-terminus
MKSQIDFDSSAAHSSSRLPSHQHHPLITLIQDRLDTLDIHHPLLARIVCQLIPVSCPFARTIRFFSHTLLVIPPLCKLNPFYDQLMGLRFRAATLLASAASH